MATAPKAPKIVRTRHSRAKWKKTILGCSVNTKTGSKGGGVNGSTPSKHYKKKYRGQGK